MKIELREFMKVPKIGRNPGHDNCVEEIKNVRRAMKRKYKYDFVCFLRLKTSISMTGPLSLSRLPAKSLTHERAKSAKRLSRFKAASYRNAKVHAHFNVIVMHLKKNARQFNLDSGEAVKSFQQIATA